MIALVQLLLLFIMMICSVGLCFPAMPRWRWLLRLLLLLLCWRCCLHVLACGLQVLQWHDVITTCAAGAYQHKMFC
jgi:hypothetical protein